MVFGGRLTLMTEPSSPAMVLMVGRYRRRRSVSSAHEMASARANSRAHCRIPMRCCLSPSYREGYVTRCVPSIGLHKHGAAMPCHRADTSSSVFATERVGGGAKRSRVTLLAGAANVSAHGAAGSWSDRRRRVRRCYEGCDSRRLLRHACDAAVL